MTLPLCVSYSFTNEPSTLARAYLQDAEDRGYLIAEIKTSGLVDWYIPEGGTPDRFRPRHFQLLEDAQDHIYTHASAWAETYCD